MALILRPAGVPKPSVVRRFWAQDRGRIILNTVADRLWCTNSYLAMPFDLFPGLLEAFAVANLIPEPGVYDCDSDGIVPTSETAPDLESIIGSVTERKITHATYPGTEIQLYTHLSGITGYPLRLFDMPEDARTAHGQPVAVSMQWLQWLEPYNADEIHCDSPLKPVFFFRTITEPVSDIVGCVMSVRI